MFKGVARVEVDHVRRWVLCELCILGRMRLFSVDGYSTSGMNGKCEVVNRY